MSYAYVGIKRGEFYVWVIKGCMISQYVCFSMRLLVLKVCENFMSLYNYLVVVLF